MKPGVILSPHCIEDKRLAAALQDRWHLSCQTSLEGVSWGLRFDQGVLSLVTAHLAPMVLDYSGSDWERLRKDVKQHPPALVKVMGRPLQAQRILDLTLGWGRDAFILSHLGARVFGIECHPAVAAMVSHALGTSDLFEIRHGDAASCLEAVVKDFKPTVIYMDPMFSEKKKKALVQKKMQVLQAINDAPQSCLPLLERSIETGIKVVIKQPLHGETLPKPSREVRLKSMRFLVFDPQASKGGV